MDIIESITQSNPSAIPILYRPKRMTIFNNKKNIIENLKEESEQSNVGLVDISSSLNQDFLVQLLVDGSPKAYIELFELTQEKQPKVETFDIDENPKPYVHVWEHILNDKQRMKSLKELLMIIETTSKNGPFNKLSQAQFEMGRTCDEVGDLEKSIFFYSNSLIIAKQIGDPKHEAQVKLNLGKVYKKLNLHLEAINLFEDFYSMATNMNDIVGIEDVSKNLIEVYIIYAEEAANANDFLKSIEFYNKCVDLANIGNNAKVSAEAKHKLGLYHYRLDQPLIALDYQTTYLSYCNSDNDNLGKTMGHSASANIFATLGNFEGEIQHLESLLDVSKLLDKYTEARAYSKLGIAYSKHGQLDYATTYFEKYYRLACELKDVKMLAESTINLGLTRCGSTKSQVNY